ncbi:ATP-dependent DNA helicase, RecQ family protein (macronuclear) [Tetrahymena thermophila SB210]|uniref:DNA 3'-5' helicase n=1 Tax=Tetrahymena thermophila (strain SB210) TaxID=312017 RepID=Q22AI7_TETTS|nr:ATP-dependent DNA helicase, RecQ family protein [Tetrahymena thermophila SB210]EAR82287.2 ATP-dependent DNA helicase, RecQ family protein [Tetrahymena thermophila SB210]|eukprot:XP_001029950.2 ATP-dependent DNA helicase, RecQ family protein [Tetrahymena thermophila SB210]
MSRVNFVKGDINMLKLYEDRQKRDLENKKKVQQQQNQLNPIRTNQNQLQEKSTSSSLKEIFYKRNQSLNNESSNKSNIQDVQKKKQNFNIQSFQPTNSIIQAKPENLDKSCQDQLSQQIDLGAKSLLNESSKSNILSDKKVELQNEVVDNKIFSSNQIIQKQQSNNKNDEIKQKNIVEENQSISILKKDFTEGIKVIDQSEKLNKSEKQKNNIIQQEEKIVIFQEEDYSENENDNKEISQKVDKKQNQTNGNQLNQKNTQKKPIQFKKTKQDNFVALDMKRKWKDRFTGEINAIKKKYTKNGRIKQKYKNKFNPEEDKPTAFDNIKFQNESTDNANSELYQRSQKQNMYVNCLSQGLLITLSEIENQDQDTQFNTLNLQDHSDENLVKVLQVVYGFNNFRSGQIESIKSIINKQSTLIVQSTGHGKSLIYQFPTLFMKGMAIVICPLISLMMDQIQKLPKYIKGVAYNSSLTQEQKQKVIQLIKENQVMLLYISPEVLQSDFSYFFKCLPEISYVCIDEAHCISEWSHNFRTSYLIINELIQKKLKCDQIIALTATATLQTQQSMMDKLKITNVFRSSSVKRDNLRISISRDSDKNTALLNLIKCLPIKDTDSIVIYCKYKFQCETLAQFLTYNGIPSGAYHSGCEDKRKAQIQQDFMEGNLRIVVATIAFGMGIDKSDIRAVIHLNMPKTVENYVQEAGRAGRDGNISYCHMFLDDEDFYRNCGHVYSDSVDYSTLKLFYEKIKKSIYNIEDKSRTVRKQKNKMGKEEIIFDKQLMESAQSKYCFIELKESMLELDSKKETLQTLIMKIGQFQNQDNPIFKIYPIGYKNCSIWFYQGVPDEMAKKDDLIKRILEISMITHGCYTFNICDMCNQIGMDPIELQKKLREFFPKIKNELKEESLIFQFLRPFEETEMLDILNRVNGEMTKYEEVSLNKIHFIYCISKMTSYPSVKYMIQNKIFDSQSKLSSISKYFDQYFNYDGTSYIKILQDADINLSQVLPYEQITKESKIEIIKDVIQFLKREVQEKEEEQQEQLLENFKNPKIITRLMQGISSYTYGQDEWKNNQNIWDRYYQYRFSELYEVVQEGIFEFIYDYDPAPKRKMKTNLLQEI